MLGLVPLPRASVRSRAYLLLSAYIAASICVLVTVLWQGRMDALGMGEKLVSAFAQITDEQTARTVQNVEQVLQVASLTLPSVGQDAAGATRIRLELLQLLEGRPYLRALWVADEGGRIVSSTHGDISGADIAHHAYFVHYRGHPDAGFELGVPLRSGSQGDWHIPAARPLRNADGGFAGLIVAAINPRFFDRAWTVDTGGRDFSVGLLRSDGRVLMRSPFAERLMGASLASLPGFAPILAQSQGRLYVESSVIDSVERLLAFRRLAQYPGLVLIVGVSTDSLLVEWQRLARLLVGAWAIATAVIGLFTHWLVREWDARRNVEQRYRLLFDASPYPVAVLDRTSRRVLAVNSAAVAQYGWSPEELMAMTGTDFLLLDTPCPLDAAGATGIVHALQHRRKDGTVFDAEMSVREIDFDGRPALLTMVQDVTERVRAEQARRQAEEQLRQAQKMEAVGQLTGGVAHDFNNILNVILANIEAFEEEENLAPEMAERVGRISKSVQRATDLVRQLLAFSRKQPLRPKPTDINDLVGGVGILLRRSLGEHIELNSRLVGHVWTVNIDRAQLETALVNLCINARDAMPNGGRLTIETLNMALDDDYVGRNRDAVAGDYVMIAVSDTGTGIAPDMLDKVFEPFFTTKEVGKGTGLGLSMVYGFIKQSQGHIKIYSEVGRGTTVKLYLPRSDSPRAAAEPTRRAAPMPRGSERILVVEDDGHVRGGVVPQLESLGYAVSEAANGAAGIAAFESEARPFDVLLTDVVMPGRMTGRVLAGEVTRRWPATKVVFMSGYTESAVVHQGQLDPGVLLLSKPFRKADLAQMIRRAIEGTDGLPRP
ncbi:MAG: ATP-binding protein [Alphaproteobacteria bacterium]|nr:ATP-binding protein [Alphaproteobacteria bacterium]